MWNFLVCSGENISLNSDRFPKSDCDYLAITMKDKAVILAGGSTDKMDYYISGIAITDAQSVQGFTPNTYTFHHTYLYDEENKQESLPFKFNDVDLSSTFTLTGSINPTGTNVNVPGTSTKYTAELKIGDEITVSGETRVIASITNDTTATVTVAWGSDLANDTSVEVNPIGEYDNLNSINVVGSSVLFNFDTYICSNNAAGNAYGLNKFSSQPVTILAHPFIAYGSVQSVQYCGHDIICPVTVSILKVRLNKERECAVESLLTLKLTVIQTGLSGSNTRPKRSLVFVLLFNV